MNNPVKREPIIRPSATFLALATAAVSESSCAKRALTAAPAAESWAIAPDTSKKLAALGS